MGEVRAGSTAISAAGSAGTDAVDVAVREAVAGLAGEANLVLTFPSGIDPERAARQGSEAAGRAPVVGMTGMGSIARDGAIERGCSAVAFGEGAAVGLGLSRFARRVPRQAARHAAAEALSAVGNAPEVTLLLFLDYTAGDPAEAVAGAIEAAGPGIPIVGGGAGGAQPGQILGGKAFTDAVLAVAIRTARPAGVGHAHGCVSRGTPASVTRSRGNHLYELDGLPAAEVYAERLGYPGMHLGDEDFEALSITHPIAQSTGRATRPRHVLARGPHGSLECTSHVEEGATIDFMQQLPADVVDSAGLAVQNAVADLGTQPSGAVVFDCASRKRAVADSLALEVEAMNRAFDGDSPPLAGTYSHGEVYSQDGHRGDHNHSVVVLALS